jgi:hypothetical protein
MRATTLLLLLPAALLTSCTTSAVNDSYGKAVEQVRNAQIYDRSTLNGQGDRAVESADPEMAALAIDSMRKDTPDRGVAKHEGAVNVSTPAPGGSQ